MHSKVPKDLRKFEALVDIVAQLRGPEGCPWDKEQTHQSLIPFAIEEVYEFIDTIETGSLEYQHPAANPHSMKEELGDMMFQVVLHAQLAQEENKFTIYDILEVLNEKMVRRHPHVFGTEKLGTSEEVLKNWEEIKANEKKLKAESSSQHSSSNPNLKVTATSHLNANTNDSHLIATENQIFDIPSHLPALQKAFKIGKKTEKTKFDWESLAPLFDKVKEECRELEETLSESKERQEDELGDLLFVIAQLARHLKLEPETALRKANLKFEKRYFTMLNIAKDKGLDFEALPIEKKEELWQEAKKIIRNFAKS